LNERYAWRALPRNTPDLAHIMVCLECGTYIADDTVHDLFHARDGRSLAATKPDPYYVTYSPHGPGVYPDE